jgi:hypothetical protein
MLERGKSAGWTHVVLDGTLIRTDRCRVKNPDTGHDLWFSGKHRAHGGNVQIVCDPDGHPVAVSEVEPGFTHDLTAARVTGFLGGLYAAAALLGLPALADKGYDGAGAGVLTRPRATTCTRTTSPATSSSAVYAPKANAASPCSRPAGRR